METNEVQNILDSQNIEIGDRVEIILTDASVVIGLLHSGVFEGYEKRNEYQMLVVKVEDYLTILNLHTNMIQQIELKKILSIRKLPASAW